MRPPAARGVEERRCGEEQVERLAVDGEQEERRREERQVEQRPACALLPDELAGEVPDDDECRGRGDERDDHPGQQVVAEQEPADPAYEERVEGEERRRVTRVGVAMLGDVEEPAAVPAPPDVDRPADVVLDHVLRAPGVQRLGVLGLEDEVGEERPEPDRDPRPEEGLERVAGEASEGRSGRTRRIIASRPPGPPRVHSNGDGSLVLDRCASPGSASRSASSRRSPVRVSALARLVAAAAAAAVIAARDRDRRPPLGRGGRRRGRRARRRARCRAGRRRARSGVAVRAAGSRRSSGSRRVGAAGLAFVPVAGYLEAVALPVLALRLRRRTPERYAGLRTLARD